MMRKDLLSLALLCLAVAVAGCGKSETKKPPEKFTTVTVAKVSTRDLPVTESAVGSVSAVGLALDYDPTQVQRGRLYVRLPFPEGVARRLKIGQPVRLTSFADPAEAASGSITEIRPPLNTTTLSRDVIVAVARSTNWHPAGSIQGEVVLGTRANAVVVPEQAVVLRPAGAARGPAGAGMPDTASVIYVVDGDVVRERQITTGLARDGIIEVAAGAQPGETVVVDGAGLLSDGARIKVREAAQ